MELFITNEVFLFWKWIASCWDVFKKGGSEFCLFGREPCYLSLPKCQTLFACASDDFFVVGPIRGSASWYLRPVRTQVKIGSIGSVVHKMMK